ncbi:MAG: hypothetical protein WBJ44_00970 [Propionicimonas sp.]
MGIPARLAAAGLAAVLLSGCSLGSVWNDVPSRAPSPLPASTTPTPEPDERTDHPYTGALASDATCVTASKRLLSQLQEIGKVGGAITYSKGARVKANAGWWTVAVATQVHPNNSGLTTATVAPVHYFVTNSPSIEATDWDVEVFSWRLPAGGDAATTEATRCLDHVPDPAPTIDDTSPDSYTGRVARKATCLPVTTGMLAHLEEVGRVGGAITYARGWLVRANAKWWTVAVATQVHPNGEGLTRDNVPATAFFVTNAPSYQASSKAKVVSFPLNPTTSDTAAAKALDCFGR